MLESTRHPTAIALYPEHELNKTNRITPRFKEGLW
jgi:hypothetical protein